MSFEKQMNNRRADKCARDNDKPVACRRSDLAEWSLDGGPLPALLSAHIQTCASCADQVRRMSEVHAGLMLMCTQAAPPNLLPRANGRGLRMLRRAARATVAAQRLLRMRPNLNRWQRAQVYFARAYVGAAAALFMLIIRTGVISGFEHTRRIGEQLADRWEEQLDPNGEWFGPRGLS